MRDASAGRRIRNAINTATSAAHNANNLIDNADITLEKVDEIVDALKDVVDQYLGQGYINLEFTLGTIPLPLNLKIELPKDEEDDLK